MEYIKDGYNFEELKRYTDSFIEMGVPGNDCAVYHKGELVYRHMNGVSDVENNIPINGKELFNVYSCSKPITCVAALQLWEQGKFDLDDYLYKYLPEFEHMTVRDGDKVRPAENKITIRHLFTMTAGLDYNVASDSVKKVYAETDGRCPTRKTIEYIAKEPLMFEPGTSWMYSLCHDVLAVLVEVVSGMKFGEYVKENIFKPLGMDRSTYNLPEERLDEVAEQYLIDENGKLFNCGRDTRAYKLGSEYESGGAGCVTCLDDYIKFLEALRVGDVILKSETIDMMTTNQISGKAMEEYSSTRSKFGYGLGVRCHHGENCPYDFGWGGAAGAYLAVDRVNDFTLFYAQHLFGSDLPNGEQKWKIGELACKCVLKK